MESPSSRRFLFILGLPLQDVPFSFNYGILSRLAGAIWHFAIQFALPPAFPQGLGFCFLLTAFAFLLLLSASPVPLCRKGFCFAFAFGLVLVLPLLITKY